MGGLLIAGYAIAAGDILVKNREGVFERGRDVSWNTG